MLISLLNGVTFFGQYFLIADDFLSTTCMCFLITHISNLECVISFGFLFVFIFIQANINGRVLAQCNIDELKKEMNMNFGDWHLFRSTVRYFILTELFIALYRTSAMAVN